MHFIIQIYYIDNIIYKMLQKLNIIVKFTLLGNRIITMSGDYKKLLNKKRKREYANPKTMGVNIDKNEYYEIILSNSAHPERVGKPVDK